MRLRSSLSQAIQWMFGCVLILDAAYLPAQGTTGHLTGKNYVIRVAPYTPDRSNVEKEHLPAIRALVDRSGGMAAHVTAHLRTLQHVEGKWFLAYFNPARQQQEQIMQDNDLLHWLCNGRDVQIIPIELTRSP